MEVNVIIANACKTPEILLLFFTQRQFEAKECDHSKWPSHDLGIRTSTRNYTHEYPLKLSYATLA